MTTNQQPEAKMHHLNAEQQIIKKSSRKKPTLSSFPLEIWHPQSIARGQVLGIDSPGDQIDRCLVGGQVALWRAGQADGTVDDDLAVVIDQITQLWHSQLTTVLGSSPEHHLITHKYAQLLLELVAWFRQAARDGHHGTGKQALRSNRAQQSLDVGGESEGNLLWVEEDSLRRVDRWDQLGSPNITCRPRY